MFDEKYEFIDKLSHLLVMFPGLGTHTINDAIEYIDTHVPEWISVNDRLPERYVNVLTCDIHGNIHENWLYKANPECWSHGYNITHWMPLPQLPKEDDDE